MINVTKNADSQLQHQLHHFTAAIAADFYSPSPPYPVFDCRLIAKDLEIGKLGVGHRNNLLPRFQPNNPLDYRHRCQISRQHRRL